MPVTNGMKWIYSLLGGALGAALWPCLSRLVFWIDDEWTAAPALVEVPLVLLWWVVRLPGTMTFDFMFGTIQIVFWAAAGAAIGRWVYRRRVRRLREPESERA